MSRTFATGIEIELEDLKNFRPVANTVLVKLPYSNDDLSIDGIYIHNLIDYQRTVPRYGEVIAVPLIVTKASWDWEPHMELQVGDTVWFDYSPSVEATGRMENDSFDNRNVYCGDDFFLAMDYHYCILAKRGEEFIPLNGYILTKPVQSENTGIWSPDDEDVIMQEVLLVGKDNKEYFDHVMKINFEPKVGDVVLIEKGMDLPLEYETVAVLEPMSYISRGDIHAYLRKEWNTNTI